MPKDYKLSYMDLNRLKTHLNSLFPNTTLKRYALVIGTSAKTCMARNATSNTPVSSNSCWAN